MPALHKNNVVMTVSGTPGTGTVTLGSAVSGKQSLATAYAANATVDLRFDDGTAWEVARDCTYTHSGTTVTRGTFEESSTGSPISLTSSATVSVVLTAAKGNRIEALLQAVTPGGRLTLTTSVPVTTSDVTGATSIYYTPYVHNNIVLWDGADWCPTTFTEKTLALGTLTSGLPYDVFGYLSSGALVLESLAWTDGTTRATAVTLQDGRYCKSGDKTRLYLGSFYTTSTTTTEDSAGGTTTQVGGKRFLWNMYNRVLRNMAVIDTTNSWTYNTATWRQANAASGNKVEFLVGIAEDATKAYLNQSAFANSSGYGYVGIGLNTTSATTAPAAVGYISTGSTDFMLGVNYSAIVAEGYNYLAWNERGGGATFTRYGDNNESGLRQSIMNAEVFA